MSKSDKHWDIFCKIVDNYGDIGICWRLAQQLAREHAIDVRLIIDEMYVAKKIIPNLDIGKSQQTINQVQIVTWAESEDITGQEADVVLETFGCELPAQYLQRLSSKAVWINLEYLSAENWVSEFHAKPSQHPTLSLTKYYFFPGFFEDTGGLIREHDLINQRDAFVTSPQAQKSFWQRIIGRDIDQDDIKISLFCYQQAPIKKLIESLQTTHQQISIFIPFNETIKDIVVDSKWGVGEVYQQENLTIHVLPFLSQYDYDHLLWACDLNCVRGEDSWVRAIWAAKPFVWQPYIQADDTHLTKINAFLSFYIKNATREAYTLIKQANLSWSGYGESNTFQAFWYKFINELPSLNQHSKKVVISLTHQPDLATKLVIFSEKLQKNEV